MNKTEIKIRGMHCRSCEMLIEEKLKRIPGVKDARVSWKRKNAFIHSVNFLPEDTIRTAIEETGYKIGIDDSKSWISLGKNNYIDLIISIGIVSFLYLIGKKLGLFNFSVNTNDPGANLFFVFLIGIAAGFSTCMALVGGFVLGISAKYAEKHPLLTPAQKFRPHLYFNLGRVASYFLLGGFVGMIGRAFQLSGTTLGILTAVVGAIMLMVGLQLTELFPRLSNLSFTLPTGIGKILGIERPEQKEYSNLNSMLIGALTFFLPCGFTQAMQLYAMSTGSFISGALIMGAFALGTTPGLLSIGGITSLVKGTSARRFFKTAGVLVVLLAFFNLSNGFSLAGIRLKSPAINKSSGTAEVSNQGDKNSLLDIQTITMKQGTNGYSPNSFTVKKGIPVRWIITSTDQSSCSSSIYSSALGIRSFLKAGQNEIDFTPSQTGRIIFTCSMGMYRGYFNVVN